MRLFFSLWRVTALSLLPDKIRYSSQVRTSWRFHAPWNSFITPLPCSGLLRGKAVECGDNWKHYGSFTVKSLLLLKDLTVSLRCRPASHLGVVWAEYLFYHPMNDSMIQHVTKEQYKALPLNFFFLWGVCTASRRFWERVINNCAGSLGAEHTQWNMSNKWTKYTWKKKVKSHSYTLCKLFYSIKHENTDEFKCAFIGF